MLKISIIAIFCILQANAMASKLGPATVGSINFKFKTAKVGSIISFVMSTYSSEEELERIKEAIDENFLPEDIYRNDESAKKLQNPPKPVHSYGSQNHQAVLSNPLSVKVTPEFQIHVSKHLSRLLDEVIDDTKIIVKSRQSKAGCLNSGIKLLSSSKGYLVPSKNSETIVKPKQFFKETLNERDYKKRAKEVAVSGEWVLSQKDTKYWTSNTKGVIETIKIDNCFTKMNQKKKS